jgi:hypothetical protein
MLFIYLKQALMIFIGSPLAPMGVDFGQLWGGLLQA